MDRPTCNNCVFFEPQYHECRVSSPSSESGNFATTRPGHWCGKHQDFGRYIESLEVGATEDKARHDDQAKASSGY